MKKKYLAIITLFLSQLFACQQKTYEYVYPTLSDGKYDSEFPYRSASDQLDEIAQSVKKIFSLMDYETYHFRPEDRYLPEDLSGLPGDSLLRRCTRTSKKFEASNGTAAIIHFDDNRIALITCAHIIWHPDTIFTYYDDNDPDSQNYLHSISVREKNRIFFTGSDHGSNLEILALDKELDLVLVGKVTGPDIENILPLGYPLGESKNLEWGNFVYIMGYPLGYQMITRGIISKPVNRRDEYFLIDASFNEGFSGGIVLAIRDGVPNFELVGLGKSASATLENFLVPEKQHYEQRYNSRIPYTNDVFVEEKKLVNYGVTRAVASHAMKRFYRQNMDALKAKGYNMDYFFLSTDEPTDEGY
jgi:hypothetical protein